jgi:hypothetical protein
MQEKVPKISIKKDKPENKEIIGAKKEMHEDHIENKIMNSQKLYTLEIKEWQDQIHCLVIADGKEWMFIKNLFDYTFDGYALLQKKFIKNTVSSEKEKFTEDVLRANNKLSFSYKHNMPLTTKDLFCYLQEEQIVIEISFKKDSYVYIGEISSVLPHSFYLKTIRTNGRWDEKLSLIRFNSVRKIAFDTDYINSLVTYSKTIGNK